MSIIDGLAGSVSSRDFTKLKIVNAISLLVEEKPLGDIRVSEICETAGVSRKTFYKHFPSKYDAIQWFWANMAAESVRRLGRDLTWFESLKLGFERFYENYAFFDVVSKERGFESLVEFGPRVRESALEKTIEENLGVPLSNELRIQAKFFAISEPHIILDILRSNPDGFDPEFAARILDSCVPRELHDLIDSAVIRQNECEHGNPLDDK